MQRYQLREFIFDGLGGNSTDAKVLKVENRETEILG